MNITDNNILKFQQKVLDTIKNNYLIDSGDGVVVGVSGGADSVCLLHLLHSLSSHLNIKLYPVHINHMLRGEDAIADEKFTLELCRKMGLELFIIRSDVASVAKEHGMSIEEAGREVRYKEFASHAKRKGAAKIAVAHNRNDQAETVMLNIIRGTGVAGLIGMEYKRETIIRPLLGIDREEIEKYCNEAELLPRTDMSNLKCEYARNRVRLELFPYINNSFGANIMKSLCRLSELAAVDDDFMKQCAFKEYNDCTVNKNLQQVELDIAKLKKLHPAILSRVLRLAIEDTTGNTAGIGKVHYHILSDLIASSRTGSIAELPNGIRGVVSYGVLKITTFDTKRESIILNKPIVIPGVTIIEEIDATIMTSVEKCQIVDKHGKVGYNSLVQLFDYDTINMGINLRSRQIGDIFKPYGSNGTKKLKDYFIDIKIPRDLRDDIPLVCIDNEVMWVVGYNISDKFKVTENTSNILKIEYKRRTSL